MESIIELIALVSGKLEESAQSDIVVGQVIDLGSVKIVPLSRLSVGMGVAGGRGEGEVQPQTRGRKNKWKGGRGKGVGGGSGMGAKVRPVGVAVFTDEGVEVLPIADKKGLIDKLLDKIPRVIEMVEDVIERQDGKKGKSKSLLSETAAS